jgi:transposase-like protein
LAHELASEWQKSFPQAATCLLGDLDACLHYFDYPPEHWKHLRTMNPVETTFSTMCLRTDAAKRFPMAEEKLFHVWDQAKQKVKPVDKMSAGRDGYLRLN